jgi:hypothetical protein
VVRPVLTAALAALLAASSVAAGVSRNTVDLIVQFEVGSQARYTARYQGVVCPPGDSGPTVGIGFDGGHQTAETIRRAFRGHPHVERMAAVMPGAMGAEACARARAQLADVRVPWLTAIRVFETDTLPEYVARAHRAFGPQLANVEPDAQGSVYATVYNRGTAMLGSARREMRAIRDECLPAGDEACMAAQYRSMTRLWIGTPNERGLGARYEATAQLAEGSWRP